MRQSDLATVPRAAPVRCWAWKWGRLDGYPHSGEEWTKAGDVLGERKLSTPMEYLTFEQTRFHHLFVGKSYSPN